MCYVCVRVTVACNVCMQELLWHVCAGVAVARVRACVAMGMCCCGMCVCRHVTVCAGHCCGMCAGIAVVCVHAMATLESELCPVVPGKP